MTIILEYFKEQMIAEEKYGKKTVVLYMIGSFYEIYGYDENNCTSEEAKIDNNGKKWEGKIGHAVELSTILNFQLTHEKNNEKYGIKNPNKIGFPCISYEKNRNTLLANNYTIVRVDQSKGGKFQQNIKREIVEVCSPSMELEIIPNNKVSNYIVSVYIEYQKSNNLKKLDTFLITSGISVIDIITGENKISEYYSKKEDEVSAVQDLYRFILAHYPKEIIINIDDLPDDDGSVFNTHSKYEQYITKILELKRYDRVSINFNKTPKEYKLLKYQTEFLNKIFNKDVQNDGNLLKIRNDKIIESLELSSYTYGRISYLLLLQHCASHNEKIIFNIKKPNLQWLDNDNHLILTHNSILQLNLVPNINSFTKQKELNSLFALLDKNKTVGGRRLLYNLLQNPMSNRSHIQNYYDMTNEMINFEVDNIPLWLFLDKKLHQLPDIARLHRKLLLKTITPKELAILYKSYEKICYMFIDIHQINPPHIFKLLNSFHSNSFNKILHLLFTEFNIDFLECCYIDNNLMFFEDFPLKLSYTDDVLLLNQTTHQLQLIIDHLNSFLVKSKGQKIFLKSAKRKQGATKQDPTNTIISTTSSKAKILSSSNINPVLCGKLSFNSYGTDKLISSPIIDNLLSTIDQLHKKLRLNLFTYFYSYILDQMLQIDPTFYNSLTHVISVLDLIHSYAKCSVKYKYFCPTIYHDPHPDSFLYASRIRHPLIELLIHSPYISNDIALGSFPSDFNCPITSSNGMILYGLNMAGKSSLTKAVGLNILMAQIGCFTPSTLIYNPYKKIITRLSGDDNIFKGESSFYIEMSELRTILRQSDHNTLVIGDEISRGTEHSSAIGIISSTILFLLNTNCSFLFSSHIHTLPSLPQISSLPSSGPSSLQICHLQVDQLPNSSSLIYKRLLCPGSGPCTYGILFAESLDLPSDFISTAYNITNSFLGLNSQILSTKTSKYNSNLYVDSCALCNKSSSSSTLHTHHIVEQSLSDSTGFISSSSSLFHKNKLNNLIVLCSDCHKHVHSNGRLITSYDTPTGPLITFN